MIVAPSNVKKRLDYFPLVSLFCFWFFGAVLGSLQIGDPAHIVLGLVTIPAVVLMLLAALKVRKLHKESSG